MFYSGSKFKLIEWSEKEIVTFTLEFDRQLTELDRIVENAPRDVLLADQALNTWTTATLALYGRAQLSADSLLALVNIPLGNPPDPNRIIALVMNGGHGNEDLVFRFRDRARLISDEARALRARVANRHVVLTKEVPLTDQELAELELAAAMKNPVARSLFVMSVTFAIATLVVYKLFSWAQKFDPAWLLLCLIWTFI